MQMYSRLEPVEGGWDIFVGSNSRKIVLTISGFGVPISYFRFIWIEEIACSLKKLTGICKISIRRFCTRYVIQKYSSGAVE